MWKYLGVVGQIGLVIAIPIVILALIGRYLDQRYDSSPYFLLGAIILSFIISSAILYSEVVKTLKLLDQNSEKKQPVPVEEGEEPESDDDSDESEDEIADVDDEE